MSGSRSQTPTISHPGMRPICSACESAILPQPTMAALSIRPPLATGFKIAAHAFAHGNPGRPAQFFLQLAIAIARLLPESVPAFAVERRRQLPLRPVGAAFPQPAKRVAQEMRQVQRFEARDI